MRKFASLILVVLIAGCSRGRVEVVDPGGMPIQEAQVTPVSASMNGAAGTTDAHGETIVLLNMGQDTKWVGISKGGFISQQVDVGKWPLKVVLQPATRP
jgi:hypothetical protein